MKIAKFRLYLPDFQLLKQEMQRSFELHYVNDTDKMLIACFEEYYFRTNSTQLNMIVVKSEPDYLSIDLVAGAGGTGIFNLSLGAESKFISDATDFLESFASRQQVRFQSLGAE